MGDSTAAMKPGGIEDEDGKYAWAVLSKYLEPAGSDDETAEEPQDICEERYIDGLKRYGLVAKMAIPAGHTIFLEEVMSVPCRDEFESWAEYDSSIAQDLAKMGPLWTEGYPELSTGGNGHKGEHASRFDEACIPYNWGGQRLNLLGMTARFLNHGCIPNAQMTLFPACEGDNGDTPNSILCRACREIRRGEEITVAYHTLHGDVAMRQRDIVKIFRFECACKDCMGPKYEVEKALACIHACKETSPSDETVNEAPAKALSIFYAMLKACTRAGLVDIRLGELMEQCAYVCGRHSDAARAIFFMQVAFSIYRLVQGDTGFDTGRAACFLRVISRIPTYGESTQGRSEETDAAHFDNTGDETLRVAFMLDASDGEYLSVQKQVGAILEDKLRAEQLENDTLHDLVQELQLEKNEEEEKHKKNVPAKKAKKSKKKRKGKKN